jgi:hypothetical protein
MPANAHTSPASAPKPARPLTLAAAETALRSARETLASLETRRGEVEARQSRLAADRSLLAYDAMTTPTGSAATALQKANAASICAGAELQDLDSAISSAKERVLAAQNATGRERQRQDARDARAKLVELRATGLAASTALEQFIAALGRFEKIGDDLRHGGIAGMPSVPLQRVATRRALDSMLMRVGLQGQLIAPSERRDLAALVASWSAQIEASIGRILDDEAA